jgi:hypothetical protein
LFNSCANKLPALKPGERLEHHVFKEVHLHRRVGPTLAVHRHPHLREILWVEPSRRHDLFPHVRKEALKRAARKTDACFEFSDELGLETYSCISYLRHGDGYDVAGRGDAAIIYSPLNSMLRWSNTGVGLLQGSMTVDASLRTSGAGTMKSLPARAALAHMRRKVFME